jgi:phospholipase C
LDHQQLDFVAFQLKSRLRELDRTLGRIDMSSANFGRIAVYAALLIGTLLSRAVSAESAPKPVPGLSKIEHIIVIYLENRSFDHLYGMFPGVEGLAQAGAAAPQVDKDGKRYVELPPFKNRAIDSSKPSLELPALPNKPFDLSQFVPMDRPLNASFEMANRYYTAQQAIDGGKMDKYVAIAGSAAMGYYDGRSLPMWQYAQQYVLADNFFQAAFGGSPANHFFLFCACVPTWTNAPAKIVAQVASDGTLAKDGVVTPDGYLVGGVPANLIDSAPLLTTPHIGNRLDAAGVSWTWYAGRWNIQKTLTPARPFLLFADMTAGTTGASKHIKDENDFFHDLKGAALPQVVFVKPAQNEHPSNMTGLLQDDKYVAELVKAVQDSSYWQSSVIIVTYDEGHSFWDHVAPPKIDRWGPGRRIPAIIISPFAKKGFVDHTQYDTTSILKLIETRFGLEPLGTRDAAAADLTAVFDLQ